MISVRKSYSVVTLLLVLLFVLSACATDTPTVVPTTVPTAAPTAAATVTPTVVISPTATQPLAPGLIQVDETTITGTKNFVKDYAPLNADGTMNFVVEIPTGTNAKWEVNDEGTKLAWDIKDGKPRVIKYLGHVGNYGMVPQTKGGDDDTLDVLAIGPAQPRGAVVTAKLIAVLKYREENAKTGPEDDKLLAILPGSPLYDDVNSLKDLNEKYPGISAIVSDWFSNYKGPNTMFFQSYGDVTDAKAVLDAAFKSYSAK